MKRIKPFRYFEVQTVAEAIEVLSKEEDGAYPLAGGTDLLVRMKTGTLTPGALVNLKRIEALKGIESGSDGDLRIGPLTPISEIERSPIVCAKHRVLAEAAGVLGSPSIRNLGTLGGNIGRASPASDMAPSLIVLRALVAVDGPEGRREVEAESFFRGPGSTVLSGGEIITSFLLPAMVPGSGASYEKLGRREGMDCALVGAAVSLVLSDKNSGVEDARVALASVAPVPLRAKKAEAALLSGSLTEDRLREAARAAASDCVPVSDMRASGSYRNEMVRVLTHRALIRAYRLAEGRTK